MNPVTSTDSAPFGITTTAVVVIHWRHDRSPDHHPRFAGAPIGPVHGIGIAAGRLDPIMTVEMDVESIRSDFPILARESRGRPLVFLDSAASSQKPLAVIAAMNDFYGTTNANVHRGGYALAEASTNAMEAGRVRAGEFIGAPKPATEIVFTKNATEALNLVARSWGAANLGPGDAVLLTELEHHANIVPWFQLQAEKGFEIRWIRVTPDVQLDLSDLDELLDGAKLIALSAMSNVTGTLTPVAEITERAHAA